MKSRVVVTGGAGFIGQRVVRKLLNAAYPVTVLDNFNPQIHGKEQDLPEDIRGDVRLIRGDVQDANAWKDAMDSARIVVHLAAETGTGQSMYEVSRYERVNISGTSNLYQMLAGNQRLQIERVVIASSRAVYGEGAYLCPEHGTVYPRSRTRSEKQMGIFDPCCPLCGRDAEAIPTKEDAPFRPLSFYALTKQAQEQTAILFGNTLGIPTFALRYQNVYGPGQSLKNPYTGILAVFSNLARAGRDLNVFEDGFESRDFVFVDDVVEATVQCIERTDAGTHVMNVGSGQKTTILEIAHAINQFFGNKSQVHISKQFRDGDIRHAIADLAKVRSSIGMIPEDEELEGCQ